MFLHMEEIEKLKSARKDIMYSFLKKIVSDYNGALAVIDDRNDVITKLNKRISELNKHIRKAQEQRYDAETLTCSYRAVLRDTLEKE